MRTSFKQRFQLAEFNRLKRQRKESLIEANSELSGLRAELNHKVAELADLKKTVHKLEERSRRKKRKVCSIIAMHVKFIHLKYMF